MKSGAEILQNALGRPNNESLHMKKTLIFVHIPKTAGTSLARIFKENYIFWPKGRVYMANPATKEQALAAMDQDSRRSIRLVHGHVCFGVHELLPQEVFYVTYLRDPLKRLLSFYNYIFNEPKHYLYAQVALSNMGFAEFLESGLTHEIDNLQVRMLAGDEKEAPLGGVNASYLERAKAHIENFFPVVGLSEYFDESLLLMRKAWDWNFFPYYVRGKVNDAPHIRLKDLDDRAVEKALSLNEWDRRLYEWAAERLESQMQDAGPSFTRQVARFRRYNKLFQHGMAYLPVYKN
jgi:hypothetical protein